MLSHLLITQPQTHEDVVRMICENETKIFYATILPLPYAILYLIVSLYVYTRKGIYPYKS